MCIMLALSSRHRIGELDIYVSPRREIDPFTILPKLQEAIQLVQRSNPRPRPLLNGYIRRILVDYPMAARGQWFGALDLCILDGEYIASAEASTLELASILVHEGQHARLGGLGVRHDASRLLRIERLCLRVQREFAEQQPGCEALLQQLEQMDHQAETLWDPEEQRRQTYESFRKAGVPAWLLDLLGLRR